MDELRRKGLAKMNEVYAWEMPNIEGDEFAPDAGGAAPYSATSVADKVVSANGRSAGAPAAIPAA